MYNTISTLQILVLSLFLSPSLPGEPSETNGISLWAVPQVTEK
jgi:hypothetical protein